MGYNYKFDLSYGDFNSCRHLFDASEERSKQEIEKNEDIFNTQDYLRIFKDEYEMHIKMLQSDIYNDFFTSISSIATFVDYLNEESFIPLYETGVLQTIINLGPTLCEKAVFRVFRSLIFGDSDSLTNLIQTGLLDSLYERLFSNDVELNMAASRLISNFISRSYFIRALVYSSGILYSLLEELKADREPKFMKAAAIVLNSFVFCGPTTGQVSFDIGYGDNISAEAAPELYGVFINNATNPQMFNQDYFNEFILHGISLQPNFPIIHMLIILSDSTVSYEIFLHIMITYLTRDMDLLELFDQQFKLPHLVSQIWINNTDINSYIYSHMCSLIRMFYFQPKIKIQNSDVDIHFKIVSQLIFVNQSNLQIDAAYALSNILLELRGKTQEIISYNNKPTDLYKKIIKCLDSDDYKLKKAMMDLFMIIASQSVNNILDRNTISHIINFLKSSTPNMILRMLYSLIDIFNKEITRMKEEEMENSTLFQQFEYCGGEDVLLELLDSDNQEISQKAEKAYDIMKKHIHDMEEHDNL